MKIRKFVCLALVLLLIGQNALCAKLYGDKKADFSLSYDAGENADILMLLKKLGIFDGEYLPGRGMAYEKAVKIFGIDEDNGENDGKILTNEDFFRLCAVSFNLKSENSKKLCDFYDFAFCSAENRGYVSAYLESYEKYENPDGKKLLRPKDEQTEEEFFAKLAHFDAEIAKKHGYDVADGKISGVSAMGSEKTISLTNGNDVVTKANDLILYIGDKPEQGCSVLCFAKDGACFVLKIKKNDENRFKTGGIYKGDVFLYDKSGHKIIFKNLKKYQKGEFMPAAENGVLTGFDAFSNFLVYENYSDSSQDKINRFLLDREAVFFTMIDQHGSEKICYIIYVG
mgnify:FL=1